MKYIINLPGNCSWVQWVMTSDKDGHAFFDFKQPQDLTPLNNELEEAYQKGYEVGQHETPTLEYQQGLEEGKKQAKVQAHLDVCHDIDRVAHGNYQKGLDDAWETIIKLAHTTYAQRSEIFDGLQDILSIMQKFSPSEVAAKLREYEQQKADEIKVGDEVIPIDANRRPFVVVSIENNVIHGFDLADGYTPRGCHRDETRWEKTGRYFPQVAELLEAMKEGAE